MTATVDHNDHDKTADVIGNYTQYHTFMCVVLLFSPMGLPIGLGEQSVLLIILPSILMFDYHHSYYTQMCCYLK